MRNPSLLTFAALAVVGPALAWADPPPDRPLQTPEAASESSAGIAAAAPMHDMNLMRQTIPPLLITVTADPYARPTSLDCFALASQVDDLTAALGDDFDAPPKVDDNPHAKRDRTARAGLHAGSEALLPFSGVVRRLSGAARHDQQVLEAIMAGQARRAYLKGLGEARGCPAPAKPVHMAHVADRQDLERSAAR